MSCQLLIIYLGGTALVWSCTNYLLIVISNKTSRAEACLELRERIGRWHHLLKVCSLPITCSFPVDKSFSFSVPGMVAWWHRVVFGNRGFRYFYFTSHHHHPLFRFLLPLQLILASVPLHVTTMFIISQHFPSSIISLITTEIIKYNNNNNDEVVRFVCFPVGIVTPFGLWSSTQLRVSLLGGGDGTRKEWGRGRSSSCWRPCCHHTLHSDKLWPPFQH